MSINVFKTYGTDEKLEVRGVTVDLGNGASIVVAREGNDNYLEKIIEAGESHREVLDAGGPAAKALDKQITTQILAQTVFLGFKGLDDENDKPLRDTEANRIMLLNVKDFRKRVLTEARKINNYRAKVEAKDAKD